MFLFLLISSTAPYVVRIFLRRKASPYTVRESRRDRHMKIAGPGKAGAERRAQLTRDRVVAAGIELADRDGIESISMRRLAQELGVEAMSLYTHVRNKE